MFKPKNKIQQAVEEVQEEPEQEQVEEEKPVMPKKPVPLPFDYVVEEIPTQTAMVIKNKKTGEQLDFYGAVARILNILAKFEREAGQ